MLFLFSILGFAQQNYEFGLIHISNTDFKGKSIGGIRCHPNQALVLTNTGEGTGEQLLELAREIKRKVMAEFGIELENEVQLIASNGLIEL